MPTVGGDAVKVDQGRGARGGGATQVGAMVSSSTGNEEDTTVITYVNPAVAVALGVAILKEALTLALYSASDCPAPLAIWERT